jgi:acyl-CoA thioester hydrolase
VFEKRVEIRWSDIDAYRHVYNARFLTYCELGRDAWLAAALATPEGQYWDYVVARVAIDFRSELRYEDRYAVVKVALEKLGRTSFTTHEEVYSPDGRLAAEAQVVGVAIDGPGGSPRPLSESERSALATETAWAL